MIPSQINNEKNDANWQSEKFNSKWKGWSMAIGKTGFTDSHTPSLPFAIEFFTLPIGIIFFIVDLRRYHPITLKKSSIHVIGLIANVCVMGYVLILAF